MRFNTTYKLSRCWKRNARLYKKSRLGLLRSHLCPWKANSLGEFANAYGLSILRAQWKCVHREWCEPAWGRKVCIRNWNRMLLMIFTRYMAFKLPPTRGIFDVQAYIQVDELKPSWSQLAMHGRVVRAYQDPWNLSQAHKTTTMAMSNSTFVWGESDTSCFFFESICVCRLQSSLWGEHLWTCFHRESDICWCCKTAVRAA